MSNFPHKQITKHTKGQKVQSVEQALKWLRYFTDVEIIREFEITMIIKESNGELQNMQEMDNVSREM